MSTINCPFCNAELNLPATEEELHGQRASCPTCNCKFVIGHSALPTASPDDEKDFKTENISENHFPGRKTPPPPPPPPPSAEDEEEPPKTLGLPRDTSHKVVHVKLDMGSILTHKKPVTATPAPVKAPASVAPAPKPVPPAAPAPEPPKPQPEKVPEKTEAKTNESAALINKLTKQLQDAEAKISALKDREMKLKKHFSILRMSYDKLAQTITEIGRDLD